MGSSRTCKDSSLKTRPLEALPSPVRLPTFLSSVSWCGRLKTSELLPQNQLVLGKTSKLLTCSSAKWVQRAWLGQNWEVSRSHSSLVHCWLSLTG